MFICDECIKNFEGTAVDAALAFKEVYGTANQSYGPCEICHKLAGCFDIPSSADWQRKEA